MSKDRCRLTTISGFSGSNNTLVTTVTTDCMLPWVQIIALDLYERSDDDVENKVDFDNNEVTDE